MLKRDFATAIRALSRLAIWSLTADLAGEVQHLLVGES